MAEVEVDVVGPLLLTRASDPSEQVIAIGLNEKVGQRGYLIKINDFQANAIAYFLNNTVPPHIFRPYVDAIRRFVDLFGALIERSGCKLDKISVTELPNDTVRADICFSQGGNKIEIPTSRPSDAISIALRLKCKIFMDNTFMRNKEYMDISKIAKPQEEIPSIESMNIDWNKVKD